MSGRCSNRELILEGAKPKSGPGAGIPSGATNPFGGFLPAAAIMRMEAGSEESTHHSGCSFPSKGPSRGSWGPREDVLPAANQKEALSLNVTQPKVVPILQPASKWNVFRRLRLRLKAGPNVF